MIEFNNMLIVWKKYYHLLLNIKSNLNKKGLLMIINKKLIDIKSNNQLYYFKKN